MAAPSVLFFWRGICLWKPKTGFGKNFSYRLFGQLDAVLLDQPLAHQSRTKVMVERAREINDLRFNGGGELSISHPASFARDQSSGSFTLEGSAKPGDLPGRK